jgi:hypothetical protein
MQLSKSKSKLFKKFIIVEAYKLYKYEYWNRTKFYDNIKNDAYDLGFINNETSLNKAHYSISRKWDYFLKWFVDNKWIDFKVEKRRNMHHILLSENDIMNFKKDIILYKLSEGI